jgi:PAS domain S-box-containing protein
MSELLKILFVEDSPDDTELILLELKRKNLNVDWKRVETPKELINALDDKWDLIISDYVIPGFSGLDALTIIRERFDYLPIIIVSGIVGEEVAVETLKQGATDYLLKNNLVRLVPAINRAIKEYQIKLENKLAEESIRKEKERIESVFRASPIGIGVIVNRIIIEVNDMLCQMMGYSKMELIGKDVELFYLSKEDYEIAGKEIYSKIAETGYKRIEVKWKHKDGKIIDVLLSLSPIKKDDLSKGITYTASDITESNRINLLQKIVYNISHAANTTGGLDELINIIKEQLQLIINVKNFYVAFYNEKDYTFSSPFMLDDNDKFEIWPAGKSITAYVYKTQGSILLTKDEIRKLEKEEKIDVIGSLPEVWMGVPLKVKGKTYGVFAIQDYEDKDAFSKKDLEILEFVSHQMSISIERKKAEEELRIAYAKAMESDRLKSAFLATMSHELRTPLNAVIGFSDLIKKDLPIEKILNFSDIINRSGRHLLEIVEDIFDVTLLEVGEVNLVKDRYAIEDLMQMVNELIQAELLKNNCDLKIIYSPTDNVTHIYTDKSKFKQILINLLKNAIKFTKEGSVKYGYEKVQEDGIPMVRFFVKDTGIGIAKDKQNIIFNIFRQVDETLTRFYGGTGIGLFIAQRFTEILGGKIDMESEEGEGSTFYVTLPVDEIEKDIKQDKVSNPLSFSKKTILVAEDDEVSSKLLEEILSDLELRYITVENGKEAVKACAENPNIDLVLMDIKMPLMNGYDATQLIKKQRPDVKVIAQTAHAIPGDKEKAINAGCDDYISKPIRKDKLLSILNKVLKRE